MTHADRAAALRALEQRALAAAPKHTILAFVLSMRAEMLSGWTRLPRDAAQAAARAEYLADAVATMRAHATASREAERIAKAAADLAEAALAVLEAE